MDQRRRRPAGVADEAARGSAGGARAGPQADHRCHLPLSHALRRSHRGNVMPVVGLPALHSPRSLGKGARSRRFAFGSLCAAPAAISPQSSALQAPALFGELGRVGLGTDFSTLTSFCIGQGCSFVGFPSVCEWVG